MKTLNRFYDVNKEIGLDVSLLKKAIIQFKPKAIITVDVYGVYSAL